MTIRVVRRFFFLPKVTGLAVVFLILNAAEYALFYPKKLNLFKHFGFQF